ncbi:50S ribosomal protein L31e [Acidianus sulfidivorans JP7]|uniref:Large ribosomal subunit protein eL31 n=1 Tax=Acidianus sulfidivorans JP7 TaxID=619593 RepID=A0A2U9INV6_9CREN|nr:50S ribosomal protein L31e [Acidianus sulfidivorans]AWR97710.1 50S ribosomal protein L31e [Acidianus sulfidivorans JP7]
MKDKDNFELTINLRKIATSKRTKRYARAIKEIKQVISRHFNAEKIIIDPILAESISTNKQDKIVNRIRVIANKIDEKTYLVKLAIKSE